MLSLDIATVDRTGDMYLPDSGGSFRYALATRSPGVINVPIYDVDAGLSLPDLGEALAVTDDTTGETFGGRIIDIRDTGFSDLDVGDIVELVVEDPNALPAQVLVPATTYATGQTVKQIFQALITSTLGACSITLDPAQADGPALTSDLVVADVYAVDVLNRVQTLTGWVWRIDSALQLRAIEPGSVSSGLVLDDASEAVLGKVSRGNSRAKGYANTIALICGPSGPAVVTQQWITDGIATSWEVDIQAVLGGWTQGYVREHSAPDVDRTLGSPGDSAYYNWDDTDGRGTVSLGTGVLPPAGTVIELVYTASLPFRIDLADAPAVAADGHPIAALVRDEKITLYAAATAAIAALLRVALAAPATIAMITHRVGMAYPGETVVLGFAARALSGTHMVVSVQVTDDVDGELVFTHTVVSGDEQPETWLDVFRDGTSGVGGAGGVVSGGGAVAAPSSLVLYVSLWGSRIASVPMGAVPAYTPVVDWREFVARVSFTGWVRVQLWARTVDVAVTARFYNMTQSASVGASDPITATTPTEAPPFSAPIVAGDRYRLEIITDTADESGYGIGDLEA
ncbi:MAG: hypothetical protein A3F70_00930 [Acidobacteria bacterium RIFCSPLOWO2_12_FULL_67_14]|nr:MAG: hypothetical protein A3F70_00930 [Acidobacteria bacterium RIFCSPLOWO2_12_FULL_67_14]